MHICVAVAVPVQTRDGTAESVSRDQFSGANADWEILIFPVELTTCRIGNLTRLIHTLAIRVAMHITVCVFFPFILDIKFVVYEPGSHRKGHTHQPSLCGACLYFSREKGSAVPFPRRT